MRPQPSAYAQLSRWDPFRVLSTEDEARAAARAGIYPALVLLFLSVARALGVLVRAGPTNAVSWISMALEAALIPLIVVAAWRIWRRQGRWSSVVVAVLTGFYVLDSLAAVALVGRSGSSLFLLLFVSGAATLGVRGSWRLHELRPRVAVDPGVFD